ncbi:HK97 family phage prohead protease [Microvirga sp. 3-52]|uniref:HK97 family phage prohead protease n=1 Tax=Microvirga sp. 3-52 TaxID=2792425 RepID=UPI0020BF850A|nr:HK97 family phage prohead protease [Microvirga sp. 3-52]
MNENYLHASPALELKLAGDKAAEGTIEGYASYFGGEPDSYGDIIAQGAYSKTLAQHAQEGSLPVMLWGHDMREPIGRWTEAKEDARGLFVRGKLNLETDAGKRAHSHVKAGDVRGLSIGYGIYPDGYTYNDDGTRTLKAIDLREISLVTIPAQRRAGITSVKSFGSRAELESILRGTGLPGRAVKKLLSGGWSALSDDEGEEPNPDIEELAKRIKRATLALKGL